MAAATEMCFSQVSYTAHHGASGCSQMMELTDRTASNTKGQAVPCSAKNKEVNVIVRHWQSSPHKEQMPGVGPQLSQLEGGGGGWQDAGQAESVSSLVHQGLGANRARSAYHRAGAGQLMSAQQSAKCEGLGPHKRRALLFASGEKHSSVKISKDFCLASLRSSSCDFGQVT